MFFLFRPAERDLPKFKTDENDKDGNGIPDDQEGNEIVWLDWSLKSLLRCSGVALDIF